jgi:hypothetical protein
MIRPSAASVGTHAGWSSFELEHWHIFLFTQFEAQRESLNAGRCRGLATPNVR